mmetsp:Transcript_38221/g.115596  ORF Transcript_38221/g.115596 Transcript_38221/m.115596 type:complete len:226 (-) Transcript_38221:59-736(-)
MGQELVPRRQGRAARAEEGQVAERIAYVAVADVRRLRGAVDPIQVHWRDAAARAGGRRVAFCARPSPVEGAGRRWPDRDVREAEGRHARRGVCGHVTEDGIHGAVKLTRDVVVRQTHCGPRRPVCRVEIPNVAGDAIDDLAAPPEPAGQAIEGPDVPGLVAWLADGVLPYVGRDISVEPAAAVEQDVVHQSRGLRPGEVEGEAVDPPVPSGDVVVEKRATAVPDR